MASVASPYGLRPINLIGGQPYAGAFREYKQFTNSANAIFTGDLVVLASGNPVAVTASPVAPVISGTPAAGTPGVVGVAVGFRYVNATTGQMTYTQYLPANAVTNNPGGVWVRVVDDPDALYKIQAKVTNGTFTNVLAAIGRNVALNFVTSGSTTTGNSGVAADVGANWASIAATASLALRIVDIDSTSASDAFPDLIVKLNTGVHAYYNSLGA